MKSIEYYTGLVNKLRNAVETKGLGKELTLELYRLIDMLNDNVLDLEQKHYIAVLAEEALSKIRDFPEKLSGPYRR